MVQQLRFASINCFQTFSQAISKNLSGTGYRPDSVFIIYTYMLWFNFILGSNFIFLCFKLIIIDYHTLPNPKTEENKIGTKKKIEPQHIQQSSMQ